MARLRRASFEDRLSLVEHLDELRTRIVVSISAFTVAFALCFWQDDRLLNIANAPLPGVRLPAPGAHRPRAPRDRALPDHGAGAVLRRRRVRLLRRPAGRHQVPL